MMRHHFQGILAVSLLATVAFVISGAANAGTDQHVATKANRDIDKLAQRTLEEGRHIFRFDTFGDEAFWGDTIKLHQTIQGTQFGGIGPGVSPKTALAVGLKVDVDALPPAIVSGLAQGTVDLGDPATALALLSLNAV